jgi:BASS family bile acid:Na+ symporter
MHPDLITTLIAITVLVLKFSYGLNTDVRHLSYFRGKAGLLVRSLLATVVLVPLFAIGLIKLFDPPFKVAATLLLLSASPGAPLATYKSFKAGGNYAFGISLQILLTIFVVFSLPLCLVFFNYAMDLGMQVTPGKVAKELTYAVLLPLGVGLVTRRLFPDLAKKYGKLIARISNILLMLLGLLILIGLFQLVKQSESFTLFAFAGFILMSLVAGHVIGGPSAKDRTTLATFCYTRNVGIAMFVASQHVEQPAVLAMVVPYTVVAIAISLVYNTWRKKSSS